MYEIKKVRQPDLSFRPTRIGFARQIMHATPESPTNPVTRVARRGRKQLAAALGLVLLAVIAYWPSLRGGFVWDDLILVTKNPLATGEMRLGSVWWRTDFSLSTVVTWLEWLAFKDSAMGYRVVNLVLHCGSALLFWKLLRQIKIENAWCGATVFALHPMAVASVAWISELKNTLSLPFFLLSALAIVSYRERSKANPDCGRRWLYAASLAAFLFALLAKTSTVVLPALLLMIVWWQERKLARRDLLQLAPHFGLALIFGLLTIYLQSHQAIRGQQVQSEDWLARITDAGIAVWFYLGKAVWPLNLCAIYPSWKNTLPKVLKFLPLALLASCFLISWRFRKSWGRPALLVAGCFAIALFPALGFFDMYFMIFARVSDHFAYLALLVVGAAAAGAMAIAPHRPGRIAIAGLLLSGELLLTWQRAKVYASDEILWRDTIQKNPRAWNAHNNLACNLAERGELDLAMQHFAASLELNPKNAQAQRNLGKALTIKGRFAEAEPHFRAALELRPDDVDALTAYADGLTQAQRFAEAIELLRNAIAVKPTIALRRQLVPLLLTTKDSVGAIRELRELLKAEPQSYEDLNNLAWILATSSNTKIRDGAEALRLSQRACELTTYQQPIPLGTLAAAYAETGDFTNAVKTAQAAIERATAAGNEQFAGMSRQLLRLYQSHRPFHMPEQK